MGSVRLGVGALAVALAGSVWAQDRPPIQFAPAEVSRADAAAANAPRVTLHAWEPERADRFDPEEAIEAAMAEVLAADPRLRFTSFDALLSPGDAPAQALAAADEALEEGKRAYEEMDLDRAKERLQTALTTYQQYLPHLAARADSTAPMRDGFLELSKVRFFEGNQNGARDALRYVFVLDGSLRWDKAVFPAQMKKLVVEARLLFDTLGSGRLVIDSDPPGAVVWLNGKKLSALTPTQPIEAPSGPNFISIARRGWAPMTEAFEVAGGGEEAHPLATLSRHPDNLLGPIDRARAHIEDSPPPSSLHEACARLGVDLLVLVRAARPGERPDEPVAVVTAYLYDARPARILNRLEMRVQGDLPATARALARALFRDVRLDGVWTPPRAPVRPKWHQRLWVELKSEWDHFRRWKGFWYVVGGVAGAALVGTVAGAAAYGNSRTAAADVVLIGGH